MPPFRSSISTIITTILVESMAAPGPQVGLSARPHTAALA